MGDDAEKDGEGPRCVGCGWRVRTLFVQYSPGNIRLMKCDNCKAVADPYIECEFMIILIDLILHKTRAYRHLLFNKLAIGSSLDKGILYQSILMHIVLDVFRISFSKGNKADGNSSRSMSTIFSWSEVLGDALSGNVAFMGMLFLGVRFILKLCYDFRRYREVLLSVIISSYVKLFLLTMMVWEFPSSAIFIVEIFVLSSNVVALRGMLPHRYYMVAEHKSISKCIDNSLPILQSWNIDKLAGEKAISVTKMYCDWVNTDATSYSLRLF